MSIFDLHSAVIADYRDFVRSFFVIADNRVRQYVDQSLDEEARLWPDFLLQVSPSYVRSDTLDDLATRGVLHEQEDYLLMTLSHKVALDPTAKQERYFRRAAGTARFVWNWALSQWKARYEQGEKPNALQLKKLWNTLKGRDYPWVYEVHKDVNQQPFRNLHKAFQRFFTGAAGYPNFKKKGIHDSFYISNDKLKVDGTRLYIPRVGWIRMREALRFDGKILGATVSREAQRWFVSMQIDVGDAYCRERTDDGVVGVDLGVTTLATLSTGEKIASPKPLRKLLKRLQTSQRRVSRKVKGSKNRSKAVQKLARRHRRIKAIRHDALHKLTSKLTSDNQVVVIEDLHVRGMMANHHLAQAVSDVGFHEFRRQLTYKAELTGTKVVVVDRWFPSSKTCSQCGRYHEHFRLAQRTLHCDCGLEIDRDHNAAINLARCLFRKSCASPPGEQPHMGHAWDSGLQVVPPFGKGGLGGIFPCGVPRNPPRPPFTKGGV